MTKSTKPKFSTSFKETAFGILPRSKIIELEKEGIKQAQEYILSISDKQNRITPELMLEVHKVGFGSIFPNWAGKFRTVDVTVGDYQPPHYSKIRELIKNFCGDLDERLKSLPRQTDEEKYLTEIVALLAWFQHQFVWIHPFKDYNGRLARLLTNLLALNLGLPILSIKASTGRDRNNYIQAMKAADQLDYSKLEQLIAHALKESLEKL